MSRSKSNGTAQRRFWPGMLGLLVALGLLLPSLAQAQALTGTFVGASIGRQVAFQHDGKAHNDWAGVLKLRLDNGVEVPVFCIQIQVRVRAGDRYRSDGAVLALPNGCQIRYLLDKYPASSANTVDEAAARQLAIWAFSDGVDPTTIEDAAVRDRAIALVNEARLGQCPARRTEPPNLALAPAAAASAAGQTVAYSVQAGPEDAGQAAMVSVTGPAMLSDAGGTGTGMQQQVTLDAQGQAHFWVTSTGAGAITVRVDLPYQLGAGTVFSHLDNSAPTQRLVLAENSTLIASIAGALSVSASAPPPATALPTDQTTPVATQAAPVATAAPPPPVHRPSRHTATPTPAGQPAETVIADTQATAMPTVLANTTAIPVAAPAVGGQIPPIDQATTGASAGGTTQVRPSSLPNTSSPDNPVGWLLALSAGSLALGGWLIRRRSVR